MNCTLTSRKAAVSFQREPKRRGEKNGRAAISTCSSGEVRGYAVITWGKMCLKDDQLAKKSVEPLVPLLRPLTTDPDIHFYFVLTSKSGGLNIIRIYALGRLVLNFSQNM